MTINPKIIVDAHGQLTLNLTPSTINSIIIVNNHSSLTLNPKPETIDTKLNH